MPIRVFIGLGSNLGDRQAYLKQAAACLPPQVTPLRYSRIYQTPPWGYTDQPAFLNQVIEAQTDLEPQALLNKLKDVENEIGRVENFRYGPRCIDLDILLYNQDVYQSDTLTIPHPSMPERAFVLVPLCELAPDLIHPVLQIRIADLLKNIDASGVERYKEEDDEKA